MVASPSLRPGTVLGGRYEILEKLGQGGHGAVFRARQQPLGREVAVKVMLPSAVEGAMERFGREVGLVQRLEHPNTVRLYDFGMTDEGVPFMVFELLRGRSLADEIAKGPLPAARLTHIATQILKSLMEAHGLGIVHRDVTPSNVMLASYPGEEDFVKVLDFGVARSFEATGKGKSASITKDGQIVGSAPYMSPEQVRGERVDARADVYALGLVLAEALSGTAIYDGASEVHIWLQHAAPAPVPLPAVVTASPLAGVIGRAVQKIPADRYASAAEMLVDVERIEALLAEQKIPPTDPAPRAVIRTDAPPSSPETSAARVARGSAPPPPPPPPSPPARASRSPVVAVVVIGVVLGVLAVAMLAAFGQVGGNAASVERTPSSFATPAQPRWFAQWERRLASAGWTTKSGVVRSNPQTRVEELVLDASQGTAEATVTLWEFPAGDANGAVSIATAQARDPGTAVFQSGLKVASVRIAGDRPAAHRLLAAIERPPGTNDH